MSWFWNSQEKESVIIQDAVIVQVVKDEIINFPNIIDELKHFQLNRTLKAVPEDNGRKNDKKNKVWQEILDNRKKILKIEEPMEQSLEQRVKMLEETVKRLERYFNK